MVFSVHYSNGSRKHEKLFNSHNDFIFASISMTIILALEILHFYPM